ncbi:unnamed protein product [Cuscuta campestris]|uniref:CCHC-type domain-containing protein n=1 Tax=Cuscuta campestris TaxID=132261 RepID=A0A484N7M5_9ASTE|nr:unnamed protein product [Cuscuta campestris]
MDLHGSTNWTAAVPALLADSDDTQQPVAPTQSAAAAGQTSGCTADGGSGESPVTHPLLRLSRFKRDNAPWINGDGGARAAAALTLDLAAAHSSSPKNPGNNKLYLLRQAMNLRFKEGSSISDHLNEFQGCFDQLLDMGVKFEDEILGLWLLNTLPDSWENLRVSLICSAPGGTVTMEYVKAAVLNEEVRRRTHETSTSKSDVLVTENRGSRKDRDHGEFKRGKSRSKSRSKYKNVECHYCHKKGHLMKNCFKLKNKDKNKPEGKDGDYGVLKMGNEGRSQVVGIRVVVLETKTGMKLVLKNVRHAPDIRLNLISTSVLDDEGYVSTFGDGQCKLTKGSLIVAHGKKCSAFVHVPKDERSKLDVKTRQCIFVGYGYDEFGYRLYDHVEKKLVRSRDVIFMEDQNIEDIQKMEKSESQSYDDLVDLNPTPVAHTPNATNGDQNDDNNHVPHDFANGNGEDDSNEIHSRGKGVDLGNYTFICVLAFPT